jgi:hypothetical protein
LPDERLGLEQIALAISISFIDLGVAEDSELLAASRHIESDCFLINRRIGRPIFGQFAED